MSYDIYVIINLYFYGDTLMFKTKKTQFAIRKLAQGASAVLLCFGILGGASAPIVSAATTDDPTKTVTESTINSENENTSSHIEITTNASDEFASIGKNGGGTTVAQNSAEPVSPDQSITENDNQQEKTTVENSTEISEPVKDINKFDNDANVDKDETITVKKPTINVDTEKVEQGDETEKQKLEEIKKYIEDVAAKHPLGIAGIFHLFGNEIDGSAHIAGNVATDKLSAGNFGTIQDATSNLTTGDIHYIGSIDHLNQIDGENKLVIFGPDVEYKSYENGSSIQVKINGNWQKVGIPYNKTIRADQILDIQGELDKLSDKSDEWAKQTQTEGVIADFKEGNSWIDVSNAIKDGSKDPIYVTIDAKYLSGNNKHEIAIKGIPADAETPIIILNVTNVQNGDLTVSTRLVLDYSDQTSINGVSEKPSQLNKLLWNFGTDVKNLTIEGDFHLGSILATNAHITANKNVDGNIIGNKITIKSETHRWDLTLPLVEVETPPEDPKDPPKDPEKPEDPPKDPEKPENPPKDPEPTPDPEPELKPEPTPDPEEESTPPLPEEVIPPTDNENSSDFKEEDTAPLPESVVEKQVKKNLPSPSTTEENIVPHAATIPTSTITEKETVLPQTGESQDKLMTIGLITTSVASLFAVLGTVIKKRN